MKTLEVDLHLSPDRCAAIVDIMLCIGKVFPEVREQLRQVIDQAQHGVSVKIGPYVFSQTQRQRGYYWKWLKAFGEFCGSTPDETHNYILCHAFGTEWVETRIGNMLRPQKRSSTANRIDYSFLIDTLIRVAGEMGFNVPPPIREDGDG